MGKDLEPSKLLHAFLPGKPLKEKSMRCLIENFDDETRQEKFHSDMHKEIRQKLLSDFVSQEGLIFIRGAEMDFQRQLRNFLYVSGIFHQVYGHYIVMDLQTKKSYLFAPVLNSTYERIWHFEKIPTKDDLKRQYDFDDVFWTTDFNDKLKQWQPKQIFLLDDQVLPSNPTNAPTNNLVLKPHIFSHRTVKTQKELRLMRVVNEISSKAHIEVMRQIQSVGGVSNEYQIHSEFVHQCHLCSLRNQSYEPIVGSGRNSAILHYTRNEAPTRNGDILLIDAGGEYYGYSADITMTYPVNGRFSPEQRRVYDIVLNTQRRTIQYLRTGITWQDVTKQCNLYLLSELQRGRFVQDGVDIETLWQLNIHGLFQPHGCGHSIGLDVHDTTKLPVGPLRSQTVVTVEPGCYFIPFLFEEATDDQKKYLFMDEIRKFYQFGGVRIEDDILINDNGIEYLSKVPRSIEDIEGINN